MNDSEWLSYETKMADIKNALNKEVTQPQKTFLKLLCLGLSKQIDKHMPSNFVLCHILPKSLKHLTA